MSNQDVLIKFMDKYFKDATYERVTKGHAVRVFDDDKRALTKIIEAAEKKYTTAHVSSMHFKGKMLIELVGPLKEGSLKLVHELEKLTSGK